MEQLLTAIIQKLESHASALGISYIDEEYGQVDMLDSETDTYPVTFPAVCVDNSGEQWSQHGKQMQSGACTINVNIYLDCYDDTHAYSTTISKVTERMAFVRSVTELLQGWEPISGTTSALIRTATTASTNNHGIKLYQVTFTTNAYESFAEEEKTQKDVTPMLTVKIKS